MKNTSRKTQRGLAITASMALLLSAGATGAFAQQNLSTRHVRDAVANGQAPFVQHLQSDQTLHIVLGLPLRNQDRLNAFLENLYNPASPNYGQYLTGAQFTEMFGPTQADYDAVLRFAQENGFVVSGVAPNRLIVEADASVASIEKAFHVSMNVYQHPTENRTFYAPDREPTANLATRLWNINGLDNYSIPRPNVRQSTNTANANTGSAPGGFFLGSDLRKAYYGSTGTLTGAGQNIGLLEYVGYNPADITKYFTTYGPPLTATVVPISTDGSAATCTTCNDSEQALDIQYTISMAPGISQCLVYVGNTDQSMLNRMVTDNTAKSLSCSWSWRPADPQIDDPIFMQMAAQGQTFAAASGDSGSWDAADLFNWPQESANVLSVGGTHLVTTGPGGAWVSETGWADSGGGISPDKIPLPSWQRNKKVITAANGASKKYRNGPDVAMEGDFQNYICSNGICNGGWGGTSFAAPEWAGFIALANQQAVSHGHPTLGFINPAVYTVGEGAAYATNFHDILTGSNGGFSCVAKFDLVTGWGSPTGPAWINTFAP